MASAREMRLRIRSVDNIEQVTRALQAVSASRVRKAEAQVRLTRPYASKAWQVLRHLARQPARDAVHPMIAPRDDIQSILAVLVSGDRGLAGAYNTNILRYASELLMDVHVPVRYVAVGRKGCDLLLRRGHDILAEFSDLPADPSFADVSAIGRLVIEEYQAGRADQVYLIYTDFVNFLIQVPTHKLLLPVTFDEIPIGRGIPEKTPVTEGSSPEPLYIYEPSEERLIDEIIPRLTELQVYQAIMESLASEHAARMVAMRNATDNAHELGGLLRLDYNKARQQTITSDMLDIVGGAEALSG